MSTPLIVRTPSSTQHPPDQFFKHTHSLSLTDKIKSLAKNLFYLISISCNSVLRALHSLTRMISQQTTTPTPQFQPNAESHLPLIAGVRPDVGPGVEPGVGPGIGSGFGAGVEPAIGAGFGAGFGAGAGTGAGMESPLIVEPMIHVPDRVTAILTKILELYESPRGEWIMVAPDSEPALGSGGIGFEGAGEWKIHVSIDPSQMKIAIPLFTQILLGEGAPRVGFKIQNRANLASRHQIGKEMAIIFDKDFESREGVIEIKSCLTQLANAFARTGIRPETGLMLTAENRALIMASKEASSEKTNLLSAKFDRLIPCTVGDFFYYRNEMCIPIHDRDWDDTDFADWHYIKVSDALRIATEEPRFAHNAIRAPDPFIDLVID